MHRHRDWNHVKGKPREETDCDQQDGAYTLNVACDCHGVSSSRIFKEPLKSAWD